MADDAFALSPINARPALPTEADYEAICSAFMETARGRWFLGEYATRNRNTDTRLVLEAVARLEETLASRKHAAPERALAELLPAITESIADARRRILEALPKIDIKRATEPMQRAAGALREAAWTLREAGADTRVCDMLDEQAKIIADGCARLHGDQAVSQDAPVVAAAALDSLALQIRSLAKTVVSATTNGARDHESATASAPVEPARDDRAAVVDNEVSSVITANEDAVFEIVDTGDEPERQPPVQPQATVKVERLEPAPDVGQAEATPAPVEQDAKTQLWDDIEIIDTGPAPTRATSSSPVKPPAARDAQQPKALAATEETPTVAEVVAAPLAQSTGEPSPALETKVAAPAETAPSPSLGQALLDKGLLPTPAGRHHDTWAPIRRMSQAEKIAFFS